MLRRHSDALRIIDANRNRAMEALRVLEEATRFVLDSESLCSHAKDIRHRLMDAIRPFEDKLSAARRIESDVGTGISAKTERTRSGTAAVVAANTSRLKESLRVLEEYSKILDGGAGEALQNIRYDFYSLERRLLLAFSARNSLREALLCVIVSGSERRTAADTARLAIEGGADIIQLREKGIPDRQMFETAGELRSVTAQSDTLFVVNDRADIASACGADGVHVGEGDLPVAEVRRLLGPDAVVGASAHSAQEGIAAQNEGADYLGVGSLFPTATKTDAVVRGPEVFREVQEAVQIPCFAVGGITPGNITEASAQGVGRVAVASGISEADDPKEAARKVKEILLASNEEES